jgi:putative acetyltransferase
LFREYEQALAGGPLLSRFSRRNWPVCPANIPTLRRVALLLALAADGQPAGCVAMRPLVEDICEMKRLYVRPAHTGQGLGKQLALKVIERAGAVGYARMRLDTLDKLRQALGLYADLGFRKCPAYYDNPLPGVVYLERDL